MSEIPEEWYGHEPVVARVVSYECSDCGRELQEGPAGFFTHRPRRSPFNQSRNDDNIYRKQQQKTAQEQRKAKAVPYTGAIRQCQATTSTPMGRITEFARCEKRAKFVVKANADTLAVCGTHARDSRPTRWRVGKSYQGFVQEPGADEPLEAEYL